MADTIALLAGRRTKTEFELSQKALAAKLIADQQDSLYWALVASIHSDARVIFPKFGCEEVEEWIRRVQDRAAAN